MKLVVLPGCPDDPATEEVGRIGRCDGDAKRRFDGAAMEGTSTLKSESRKIPRPAKLLACHRSVASQAPFMHWLNEQGEPKVAELG